MSEYGEMEAGRRLDGVVEERVFGHPIVTYVTAWGECELDTARPEPGDDPAYVEQCACDTVREWWSNVLARTAEKHGWTQQQMTKARRRHEADWFDGHHWQCYGIAGRYSTLIAPAFEVVEELDKRGWRMGVSREHGTSGNRYWRAYVSYDHGSTAASADTAPLAICRAALKAVDAGTVNTESTQERDDAEPSN